MVNWINRDDWGAMEHRERSHDITPENGGIAIHHVGASSSIDANHSSCAARVRGIQRQHMFFTLPPYDDIAYNHIVCVHGYTFFGRGGLVRSGANGTDEGNQNYYAILGMMGLPDPVSNEMVDEIQRLIEYMREWDNAGPEIVGHRDLFSTECPGRLYEYVQGGHLEPGSPPDDRPPPGPTPPGGGDGDEAPTWPGVLFTNPTEHQSVLTWQARMQERGWNIEVDGVYGDHSELVCSQFQEEKGLTVDGIVGEQTWVAAWEEPITPGPPDGSPAPAWPGIEFSYPPETVHSSVTTWQNRMLARGWNIGVDGVYGPQSETVCTDFQEEKGLTADGIVGEQTWAAAWEEPIT